VSYTDFLTAGEFQAANPQGVPLGVNTPGGTAFVVPGSGNISGASLTNGISGTSISQITPAPASETTTNPQGQTAAQATGATPSPAGTSSITAGSLGDYFARAIIVILGFIFVAVGLNMLRPGTIPLQKLKP
jgi:hypothetical protein